MSKHPIQLWCYANGITLKDFAVKVGISRPHLYSLMQGKYKISKEIKDQIYKITKIKI